MWSTRYILWIQRHKYLKSKRIGNIYNENDTQNRTGGYVNVKQYRL